MFTSKMKFKAILFSFATMIGASHSSAQAQTSLSTTQDGRLSIFNERSASEVKRTITDNSGNSPEQVWIYKLNEEGEIVTIDGPRQDVDDIFITSWSSDRRKKTLKNPLGHITEFHYDESGRLVSKTDPNGLKVNAKYDENGYVVALYTEGNEVPSYNLSVKRNATGEIVGLSLPSGRNISASLPMEIDKSYLYYVDQEIAKFLESDKLDTQITRPQAITPKSIISGVIEFGVNKRNHSADGILQSVSFEDGGMALFEYDNFGNLSSITDAVGVKTIYQFDGFGRLIVEDSKGKGRSELRYDSAGNVVKHVREGNVSIRHKYDPLNRIKKSVVRENGGDKIVHKYVYDKCQNGIGRLCILRSDETVTSYSYTELGQHSEIRVKNNFTGSEEITKYGYGQRGELETIVYPNGLKVFYGHDNNGAITTVSGEVSDSPRGEKKAKRFKILEHVQIDAKSGFVKSLLYPNGLRTSFLHNERGALTRATTQISGTTVIDQSYTFTEKGKLSEIFDFENKKTTKFKYDIMGRLLEEIVQKPNAGPANRVEYTYDEAGNRTSKSDKNRSRSYHYDKSSNRFLKSKSNVVSYDLRGNSISDKRDLRRFVYDPTNRLTKFYKKGELRATYDYNAIGQRVAKSFYKSGDLRKKIKVNYLPSGEILSETVLNRKGVKIASRSYIWLGNVPIAQFEQKFHKSQISTRLINIHSDHLNTPRNASDQKGTIVWKWDSNGFGQGNADLDPDGDGVKTNIRLRFPGQYHDEESGLFYNGKRDYDPSLGRYIQSDPLGLQAGVNRYAYALNNPIENIDASGLKTCTGSRIKREASYDCGNLGATCFGKCGGFHGTNVNLNITGGSGGGGGSVSTEGETRVGVQTGGSCNSSGCTSTGIRYIIRNRTTTSFNFSNLFSNNFNSPAHPLLDASVSECQFFEVTPLGEYPVAFHPLTGTERLHLDPNNLAATNPITAGERSDIAGAISDLFNLDADALNRRGWDTFQNNPLLSNTGAHLPDRLGPFTYLRTDETNSRPFSRGRLIVPLRFTGIAFFTNDHFDHFEMIRVVPQLEPSSPC